MDHLIRTAYFAKNLFFWICMSVSNVPLIPMEILQDSIESANNVILNVRNALVLLINNALSAQVIIISLSILPNAFSFALTLTIIHLKKYVLMIVLLVIIKMLPASALNVTITVHYAQGKHNMSVLNVHFLMFFSIIHVYKLVLLVFSKL